MNRKSRSPLALEDFELDRFTRRAEDYRDRNLRLARTRAKLGAGMSLLGSVSTLIMLAVGGPMVVDGRITLGSFLSMVLYLQLIAAPTGVLGFVMSSLQRGASALRRIGELMDEKPTLIDPPPTVAARHATGPTRGSLQVTKLGMTLENREGQRRRVLDEVSFRVEPGELIGVVGPTGAGHRARRRPHPALSQGQAGRAGQPRGTDGPRWPLPAPG